MSTLRLTILKSEDDWSRLMDIIEKRYNGKQISNKGNGLSFYISTELNKEFKKEKSKCTNSTKAKRVRKSFTLKLPDDVVVEIKCLANSKGEDISTLITRLILDPCLSDHHKTT